jgi:predicted PurR-regulated permease PerM
MDHTSDLKALRRSAGLLVTISLFVIAYFARDLILPVMVGVLIALTLSPVNRLLDRGGLPKAVSAGLLVTATAATIASVAYFAGGTIAVMVEDAPQMGRELQRKLSGVTAAVEAVQEASDEVESIGTDAGDTDAAQEVVVKQPGLLNSAVTGFASTLTTIGVALILAFFLLASGELFYIKLVQSFSTMAEKKRALSAVYDIERKVSKYLFTITVINAGLGLTIGLALWALGLQDAYIWGIAAFLLNYLPFLGGLVGMALVGVYAIVTFDSVYYALLAPLSYQALTTLEGQFLTPYLVGKRLEMNAVAVFLAVVVWAWLWGVAGALVAVPFLLVFKVICDNFEGLATVGNFLGPSPDNGGSA